jgi:hypothetical protein
VKQTGRKQNGWMRGDIDGCEVIQMGVRSYRWARGKTDGREAKQMDER